MSAKFPRGGGAGSFLAGSLIIECINKKEFQASRAKFNVTGLHKLPPHLATPLLYTIEALPEVCVCGGGGGTCSLVPSKTNGVIPPKQNFDFLCSLFPKIACVPLFLLFLGLCSPVPLKQIALVPLFPKTPGRALLLHEYFYSFVPFLCTRVQRTD